MNPDPAMLKVWRMALSPRAVGAVSLLLVFLLPALSYAKDYSFYGRDIGCREIDPGRARKICEAIATSLTWQWMGHAIIAPGYKPAFEGVRKVYCELKINEADVNALKSLKAYDPGRKWMPDWRLESAADMLLQIVINLDTAGEDQAGSIFDPNNPKYILKGRCF